jgi:hypothetical protein
MPRPLCLRPLLKDRAPMSFRLHAEALNAWPASHAPFHLAGTGFLMPASLKLSLSGQTPVSTIPMITSSPYLDAGHRPAPAALRPRNSGVRVVWRRPYVSGNAATWPSTPLSSSSCAAVSAALNPRMTWVYVYRCTGGGADAASDDSTERYHPSCSTNGAGIFSTSIWTMYDDLRSPPAATAAAASSKRLIAQHSTSRNIITSEVRRRSVVGEWMDDELS